MNSTLPLVINGGLVHDGLATAVLLDDEQDIARHAVCPMCHTSATVTQSAIEAGGDWRCVRCVHAHRPPSDRGRMVMARQRSAAASVGSASSSIRFVK